MTSQAIAGQKVMPDHIFSVASTILMNLMIEPLHPEFPELSEHATHSTQTTYINYGGSRYFRFSAGFALGKSGRKAMIPAPR
jgi:hypothetical protein